MMQTTICKWGSSQGIKIPQVFFQNINITENDTVDVILEDEKIIIKKCSMKEHKTTKERIMEFYGAEFSQNNTPQKEIDWGSPVGKEIW